MQHDEPDSGTAFDFGTPSVPKRVVGVVEQPPPATAPRARKCNCCGHTDNETSSLVPYYYPFAKHDTVFPDNQYPVHTTYFGVLGEPDSGLRSFGTPFVPRKVATIVQQPPATTRPNKGACCSYETCNKAPSFAPEGTKKPLRCGSHKEEGDVNVKHKPCSSPGCRMRARFGPHGSTPTRCSSHKETGDVNLTVRMCEISGCQVSASCHPEGEKPVRCVSHKMEGDVTSSSRSGSCVVSSCNKRALFRGESHGVKHCKDHYDSFTDTGTLHLMCQTKGCTKHATFGDVKNKALRCSAHKIGTDRDVVNTMCVHEGCGKRPSFAPAGSRAKRCKTHSAEGEMNVIAKRCSAENCAVTVAKGARCRRHLVAV